MVAVLDRGQQWREIVRHPPAELREGFTAVAELSAAIGDFAGLLKYFHVRREMHGEPFGRITKLCHELLLVIEVKLQILPNALESLFQTTVWRANADSIPNVPEQLMDAAMLDIHVR